MVCEPDLITFREAVYIVIKSGLHTIEMDYLLKLRYLPYSQFWIHNPLLLMLFKGKLVPLWNSRADSLHRQVDRGVEISGPPGPLGHGHLRTDPTCVLPVQMSGKALEAPKDQKIHISASICPTEKYNLSNCIRISQATHFHTHLKVLHSFSVWNLKW